MAIATNRVKTLGNGIAPITTSDFLKDNENKNVKIELTNVDPNKNISELTDSKNGLLDGLGDNIKAIIKATLNKIKSGMKWIADSGSDMTTWLHDTISKFLGMDLGLIGGPLSLRNKTMNQILNQCGIFSSGLKINFGIPNIAFWLYALMAILLQLLCMGINSVFSTLMKLGENIGIPKAAFGGAMNYLINSKVKNGIDNIIDINSTSINVDAHTFFSNPGKSFLNHIDGSSVLTRDPVSRYGKVKSSLDVLAPKWAGSDVNTLSSDIENSFNGENIVGNETMTKLADSVNLNIINKPNLDPDFTNNMIFTKNISLMKIVKH